MSKRRWQGEEGQANCHDNKHKSLYLVLDDWYMGFTIRKVDANSPDLSAPPVLRLASPRRFHPMDFAALGNKIIATSNRHTSTVVFDTESGALAMGNPLPDALLDGINYFVTAGRDMLIAFAYFVMSQPHSFEVMTTTPKYDMLSLCPSTDWSWKSMPKPFTKDERITSYALHPDGHTIFVSVDTQTVSLGTFSFDTKNREWRRRGEWMFPFELEGFFDAELDAWVGLHRDGYVCSCQVPPLSNSSDTMQQPDWRMAKELKMWSPQRQLAVGRGATLTYMGNSRFFLVDCVAADGLKFQDAFGDCHGTVLTMTTFSLRYDREGNLRIKDRSTTSVPMSKHLSTFSPVAFWM